MCHHEALLLPGAKADLLDEEITVSSSRALQAVVGHPNQRPRGAVVVVSDIFGVSPFYRSLASYLAGQGYLAIVPNYFTGLGHVEFGDHGAALERRNRLDEPAALGELAAVVDWAKRSTASTRVGTLGFCMGGTFALDLAADRSDLATVSFYGFPGADPHAPAQAAPAPLDRIEQLSGPIIAFWGDADIRVAPQQVSDFEAAVAGRANTEVIIYPGATHGFFVRAGLDPEDPSGAHARDALQRMMTFMGSHVG